jgi:hypothetical protein
MFMPEKIDDRRRIITAEGFEQMLSKGERLKQAFEEDFTAEEVIGFIRTYIEGIKREGEKTIGKVDKKNTQKSGGGRLYIYNKKKVAKRRISTTHIFSQV